MEITLFKNLSKMSSTKTLLLYALIILFECLCITLFAQNTDNNYFDFTATTEISVLGEFCVEELTVTNSCLMVLHLEYIASLSLTSNNCQAISVLPPPVKFT